VQGAHYLSGGQFPAMAYAERFVDWGPAPVTPKKDALALTATNLRSVTVDVRRAGLTCRATVTAKTDGPLAVVLQGCGRTLRFG
jgi:hypothetical protein